MRIDYFAGFFMQDGPKLLGRSLVRHLKQEHDVTLLGAIVEPDAPVLDGPNAPYCRLETELDADVVFFENGWVEMTGSCAHASSRSPSSSGPVAWW